MLLHPPLGGDEGVSSAMAAIATGTGGSGEGEREPAMRGCSSRVMDKQSVLARELRCWVLEAISLAVCGYVVVLPAFWSPRWVFHFPGHAVLTAVMRRFSYFAG